MRVNKKVLEFLFSKKGNCIFCIRNPVAVRSAKDNLFLNYYLCLRHKHIKLCYKDLRKMALNNGRKREANTVTT